MILVQEDMKQVLTSMINFHQQVVAVESQDWSHKFRKFHSCDSSFVVYYSIIN
jgi:hypothetical protein